MAKILILISAHLCMAPRPQKEAEALANAGHDVIVCGFWFDPKLIERDRLIMSNKKWRFEPIIDFQPIHLQKNIGIRLQSRVAREIFKRFAIFSPSLLGYGIKAMLKVARQVRADLTIVHSEAGLWVGNCLLNEGYRVGVDFEDWFSEDILPNARASRPIAQMKLLERRLARDCTYCLTTSHALAEVLAEAYQAPKPTVIYNTFPWAEHLQIDRKQRDRHNLNLPSIHWFSQTIGPGRGLETLFQALQLLKIRVEIHLRGNYSENYRQYLESLVPNEWRNYLFIHPTVSNMELLSRIAEHDIGLALEIPYCPNKQFTVSNKFFQYQQAGLAVIATDTVGQEEIFSQHPTIGRLIPSNNPLALTHALNDLLESSEQLKIAKYASLKAFKEHLCWENEAQKIVKLAALALSKI